jgi:archaellum biogenesis ATPase FlaH
MVLAHVFKNDECRKRAKEIRITPDDFVTSASIGLQVLRPIAEIAFMDFAGSPPFYMVDILLQQKIDSNEILPIQSLAAKSMLKEIYEMNPDEASIAFVKDQLVPFMKSRREAAVLTKHIGDADELLTNLSRLKTEIATVSESKAQWIMSPFSNASLGTITEFIPTGIPQLDLALGGGFGRGDYTILAGYTGGGKTTMGVMFCANAANLGYNTLYVSREEKYMDIVNRFRANRYNIQYAHLRNGNIIENELSQIMEEKVDITQMMNKHLRIANVRDYSDTFTAHAILDIVQQHYREQNWAPDLIVIDQLEFMEPMAPGKYDKEWDKQAVITNEVDRVLSHHVLGGKHQLTVVLLHQAKGAPKFIFTCEQLSGSKGIMKPSDLAIGVGRKGTTSTEFNCFSLKTRHNGPFSIPMDGSQLAYMRFNFEDKTEKLLPGGNVFTKKKEENTGRNVFSK